MRHRFEHNGQLVYEWDQALSEINIFIQIPDGVKAKQLYVDLEVLSIRIGITPNPPYLQGALGGPIKVSESFWTVDGRELQVQLTKQQKGESWSSALAAHAPDLPDQEADKKRMLLERFQEEHPGFDFRDAEVVGDTPNARTFMGGIHEK